MNMRAGMSCMLRELLCAPSAVNFSSNTRGAESLYCAAAKNSV